MDSGANSGTLTREDLQKELQTFANGRLAESLLKALKVQQDEIAAKVCEKMKEDAVLSRAFSDPAFTRSVSPHAPGGRKASKEGRVRERKDPAKFHSVPHSVPHSPEPQPRKDLWQPSLKYEAKVAARSAPRRTRGIRRSTSAGVDPKTEGSTNKQNKGADANASPSARALLQVPNEANVDSVDEGLLDSTRQSSKPVTPGCQFLRTLVESSIFEQGSGLVVVFNSISMGYDANYLASHPDQEPSVITKVTERAFCLLFTVELILRIGAFGSEFFSIEDGWKWNCFDTVVVLSQVLEQAIMYVSSTKPRKVNLGILRLLRFLRVIRFARLFRVFHLFDDLRVIVSSIGSSISSLAWSMLLLMILIYVFSLLFLQSVASAGQDIEHHEELQYYFGSLFRTTLTMFECIVGGVNWDRIVWPMASDISPLLAVAFCVYISASLFAMMNILTGIFVDKAMSSVREDKDVVLAKRVRDLFFTKDKTDLEAIDDEITWEVFRRKLETQAMKDYFNQINVEISEARSLFDLMDTDGSGSLNSEEIVRACLQLRGPARALELSALARDVSDLRQQLTLVESLLQHAPHK